MIHLVLALVLGGEGPPIGPHTFAGKPTYRVNLRPERRDYQLVSPPGPGRYTILIAGANPSGKAKLVFSTPLPPGSYSLSVRTLLGSDIDQTFSFSVPLAGGQSSFTISAGGQARYDFAFQFPSKKEYRFTFVAPVTQKLFRLVP